VHTLLDDTSNEGEVFDAALDLGNLADGETMEVFVEEKLVSGGTLHRVYYQKYVGVQDDTSTAKSPVVYLPALTVAKEWKLSIKQTDGTGRDVDWTVYK
jgi:hypothetical protein